MRRLYLVPIVHSVADMGSLGAALDARTRKELGTALWLRHRETVSGFWAAISNFFERVVVSGCRVFQDGLVIGGPAGIRIIQEGAHRQSPNYAIIARLLERGSVLEKTEDLTLVKEEYGYISSIANAHSMAEKGAAALRYARAQDSLLRKRDEYIARRINNILGKSETGILFIGADHDVHAQLAPDIKVVFIKEIDRIREYYRILKKGSDSTALRSLSGYLQAPVELQEQ